MKRLHIIGRHNAGKTTLLLRLVPALRARGLRVGILKHAPHIQHFEGRADSGRFAQANPDFVVLAKNEGGAIYLPDITEISDWEKTLASLFPKTDLLLVEGYKSFSGTRIEVWHADLSEPPLSMPHEPPLFFVSREPLLPGILTLPPDDIDAIAEQIHQWWID